MAFDADLALQLQAVASPVVPAIAVSHLQKGYGDFMAVDDVSFTVAPGDFFAFLGPNGAGKTTTINTIVGLANYQHGAVSVFGHDVQRDFRQARLVVGLAPQEFNFDRYLSVEEILLYQAGYFGITKELAKPRAEQLLKQFELWEKKDRDVTKLSGGMKRRLTLARALIHAPKLLILDEPTAGVDLELRLELWAFLRALNRQGMTIFLTTHYLEEAQQLCNRVGIIDKGKLAALEDTSSLLARLSDDRMAIVVDAHLTTIPPALDGCDVALEADGRTLVFKNTPPSQLPAIVTALVQSGLGIANLDLTKRNLQDIFLELTRKTTS